MPRLLLHSLAAWVLFAPATASAATVQTDLRCYLADRQVKLTGEGFSPGARYTVVRDGQPLGEGKVGADGKVAGSLSSGQLDAGVAERSVDVSISDGTNEASTRFRLSAFRALFTPSRGDPRRLRVRFSVFGFGSPNLPVYLHYVDPDGRLERTIRLGETEGDCGRLSRSRQRRLFPFRAERGEWRLQFDTRRAYRPGSAPRIVRAVKVRRGRSKRRERR
jgi:hypothetical protein